MTEKLFAQPQPGVPSPVAYALWHLDESRDTPVSGEPLSTHLDRLAFIRDDLISVFTSMSIEDFRRLRPSGDTQVTPEWVLTHLARHESEHRGQIWEARVAVESGDPG